MITIIFSLILSLLSKTIIDVLVFIWIFFLAWVLGGKILKSGFRELPLSWLENITFSIGIGFGVYSFFIFILSLTGFLYKQVVFPSLILISILFLKDFVVLAKEVSIKIKNLPSSVRNSSNSIFASALFSIMILSIGINFVGAIAPEIQYDALNYHLTVPRIYIEHHGAVQLPHILQSYFAKSIEMLYGLGLILSGQITAKLFSLCFGILVAVAVFSFGKRSFSVEIGVFAAAFFYVSPLAAWLSTTTYIDLATTFYIFSAVYGLTLWWKTGKRGFLFICGLMSGLALSAKLNAALALVPMSLSILAISCHLSRRNFTQNIANFISFTLPILIITLPWYMVTYFHTSNPVFPFYNAIFKSPLLPPVNTFLNLKDFGMGSGVKDFLLLPWNLTYHTKAFIEGSPDGFVGFHLLIAMVSILFFTSKPPRILPFFIFIFLSFMGIWFCIGQYLRYFLPIVPIYSLLASYVLAFFKDHSPKPIAILYRALIIIGLMFTIPLQLVTFWNIPERIPYKVAFGLESTDEYLSRTLKGYHHTYQYVRYQYDPKKVKVLLAGNDYLFYSHAHLENLRTSLNTRDLLELSSKRGLSNLLIKTGFTHIMVDKSLTSTWKYKPPVLHPSFLNSYTKLEFSSDNIFLYHILTEKKASGKGIKMELLENPGFEEIQGALPARWNPFGNPTVDFSGKKSHTGKGAIKTSRKDFFTQVLPAEANTLYKLTNYIKADKEGQFARLQINWLFEGKIIRPDIRVVPAVKDKWICHSMSVRAPENAQLAVIYASVHEDSEVWFDDFSFVEEND